MIRRGEVPTRRVTAVSLDRHYQSNMTRGFSPGQIIMERGDGIDEGCGLGARDLVLDLDLGASKAEEEYSIALP